MLHKRDWVAYDYLHQDESKFECPECGGFDWEPDGIKDYRWTCLVCGYVHDTPEFDGDAAYHRLKEEGW